MDLSFIPSRAAKAASDASGAPRGRALGVALFIVAYIAATALVAEADLGVRSLVLVAAVFGVLAISLDLVAGMIAKPPAWIGEMGLEWLFRLSHEPGRLWRRYLQRDPRFAFVVARRMAQKKRGSR